MTFRSLFPTNADIPLLTDLYQLTMAAAYHASGIHRRRAVFELFVRKLPKNRSFLVVAGLEQALHAAMNLRFGPEETQYLRELPQFAHVPGRFFDTLAEFEFRGDIDAMPEGTIAFPDEPILRATGDILAVQLLETAVINAMSYQTSVASKAARVVLAARGRPVVEFGMRRGAGVHAAQLAARAALIAGCKTTSNVAAARLLGVVPTGTMAHSWVQAHDAEQQAFDDFASVFPESTTALVDTYDVMTGVKRATKLGKRLAGIRLDSGDLGEQAVAARKLLDEAGCHHAKIFASSDLNEFKIDALLERGAPIDAFGVGTEMITVRDAPALSMVYKLVELNDEKGRPTPRLKKSESKATIPYGKQVFRRVKEGRFAGDMLVRTGRRAEGVPLLEPVMKEGIPQVAIPPIQDIARRTADQLAALPDALRRLDGTAPYPVDIDDELRTAMDRT